VVAICLSALALAIWPNFAVVMGSRVLHAAASCVLGPVIAAISLGLVGHARSARGWAATPASPRSATASAAAAMGACGSLVSSQAVFFLTAILAAPAILALTRIRMKRYRTSQADQRRNCERNRVARFERPPAADFCRMHPAVPAG
jgi:predicted MFS family arabinose efflux permease